jgi:hypothetical protein
MPSIGGGNHGEVFIKIAQIQPTAGQIHQCARTYKRISLKGFKIERKGRLEEQEQEQMHN